ncbi:GntR family transcriptional regulator [Paenarthrobacter sp. NPDC089675]|uniref:GntR family transcriptional regulator n=1 Tax=Paenarthrobacter sp. NPDC089675 TaxID=3364376 RepID=UPI00381BFA78
MAPPLSPRQMEELFDAREVVEIAAINRASAHLQTLVPALAKAHDNHRTAAEHFASVNQAEQPTRYRKYFEADWNFHETILRNCGNLYLLEMADLTITHTHRVRHNLSHGLSDSSVVLAEHEEILVAFQRRDIAEAAEAMRKHIAKTRNRALQW